MIISNNRQLFEQNIEVDQKLILPTSSIKILGSTLNSDLNWNDTFVGNKFSLINSIKRRSNAIINLSNKVGRKFAKQISSAILFGKLNYHCEILGATSQNNTKKINNIIMKTAKSLLGGDAIGRTNKWILKKKH